MHVDRRTVAALCAAASLVLSGCIQSSTTIKLQADGSGTIEQTTTMNADAVRQFAGLAAMGNDQSGGSKGSIDEQLFSEKDARAEAAKLGTGVTFVSSQKIDTADRKGLHAVYAFSDIRKLSVQELNAPSTGGGSPMGDGPKDPPITFGFSQLPNGHAQLTVLTPGLQKGVAGNGDNTTPPADPKMAAQGAAMMKMFMKGLKINVAIQVPRMIKTNGTFVTGNTVTLLNMDFDKVLDDPALLEKMNHAKSLADSKALLKNAKGFQINLEPQLTIEFAGK